MSTPPPTHAQVRPTAARGDTVTGLLAQIADVGADRLRGGYSRPVYSAAELTLREWFVDAATTRGLAVEVDRNGVLWGWWDTPTQERHGALVTGSHLDSVPGGGAFDGPLGVASALVAVDHLRTRGVQPRSPLAIAVFPEEEGSRFGVACLGSRLMTGAISADRARGLRDADGVTLAERSAAAGIDPSHMGADPESLARIGAFVELHVEQGRGLVDRGRAVGVASYVLGHGRWKMTFTGQGNHAGTTLMADRRDPVVVAAQVVLDVRRLAASVPDARATVGRLVPTPGGTNVIASRVDLWLDVRHPVDDVTHALVREVELAASQAADDHGCDVVMTMESYGPTVQMDPGLRDRLTAVVGGAAPMGTGAGHDAAVLAGHLPAAMLFVRNPTGISHSPEERVEPEDAEAGAEVLADVLAEHLTAR